MLLRNTRKTECGASMFPAPLVVRAAPFALLMCAADPGLEAAIAGNGYPQWLRAGLFFEISEDVTAGKVFGRAKDIAGAIFGGSVAEQGRGGESAPISEKQGHRAIAAFAEAGTREAPQDVPQAVDFAGDFRFPG